MSCCSGVVQFKELSLEQKVQVDNQLVFSELVRLGSIPPRDEDRVTPIAILSQKIIAGLDSALHERPGQR